MTPIQGKKIPLLAKKKKNPEEIINPTASLRSEQ